MKSNILQRKPLIRSSIAFVLLLIICFKSYAQCPPAPTVTSPVNLCKNTTASSLTATGTSLLWGGTNSSGVAGGTSSLTSGPVYTDATYNNRKTNFTTTANNVTINTVDYYIRQNQSVNGLVLSIYNSSGTVIATSSTNTTQTAGASAIRITNTFNYTITTAGNYSIGLSSGSGNIGYDNPSFPVTESTGTINVTGVSSSPYRCFNNIVFTTSGSSTAPVPSTATVGSTNYTVTQTANGCTSSPATITVIVSATGGSAPAVTSPITLCKNTTVTALTATGSNLTWGGAQSSVGGSATFSSYAYIDGSASNNRKTVFTTNASTTINTVDYTITANQSVSSLVLGIFDNAGTLLSSSSTTTTQTAGGTAIKITNTFNYTLSSAGTYSIGVASGTGNIGYDNPSFPLTESTGTINITGVSGAGNRCFNNIVFTLNSSNTAPTPLTTTTGTTNYYVSQTVNGCLSPAATISVIVNATGGSAPSVTSPVNYCINATASPLTASGSNLLWTGAETKGTVGGTSILSNVVYIDATFNNRKMNFTVLNAGSRLDSVDYYIPANQAVSGLVLSIYNSSGTVIATSVTNTTQTAGASAVKIRNYFNYSFPAAGNYSIGVSSGTGNIGYDSPSFPITESSGTINITGVASSSYRCFNNIVFTILTNSATPTPSTSSAGTTNYTVTQTVAGCLSPAATIVVNVGSSSSASVSYSSTTFCKSVSTAQPVTQGGASGGTYSAAAGLSLNTSTGAITPSASTAGSYTVTYTVNGACPTVATTSVTITAVPSATVSYTSNPYCSNGGTATVTRTGTAGGIYTSTTGLIINSSTGDVNPASSTTGTYTVTYTIAAAGGCSQFQTTTSITIGTAGTWTGSTGTGWTDTGNWFCGQVPGASTNVIIPGSLSNYPVITTTQAINNITISTGASVTVSGGTLQLGGTINNSGTFISGNGSIEMNGIASQAIPAGTFQNNSIKNLIISNTSTGGVTLAGAMDVYGTLSFTGTGMKLNTNDQLTLKSNASGTATVGVLTGNTINGEVTVERYISAKKAWRFLSVPTNTVQTIKQTWQEGATGNNSNPVPGYGIQITGGVSSSWSSNGFDLYSATPSMKIYNASNNTWTGISGTSSTNIKSTEGYMTFIRGDRTANAFNAPVTETVLRTKGTLYTGDQAPIDVAAGKFAAFGNPYASVLDMRNITKTGFRNFFYIWDPNLGGNSGYGAYQAFSYNGSDYEITPGGGSYGASGSIYNYIESGQAFLMQAGVSGARLTFGENAKAPSSSRMTTASGTVTDPQLRINLFGINADASLYPCDGTFIEYNDGYNTAVDDMDAVKNINTAENLSVKNGNDLLIIERRHTIINKDTVFLHLTNTKVMNYRFEIAARNFNQPGLIATLEDNYLHTSTWIDLNNTAYFDFNVINIPGSYAADRFKIIFSQSATLPVSFTSIKAYKKNEEVNIEWKVENEININAYQVERSQDAVHFDAINNVQPKANSQVANYITTDRQPLSGVNYYRIKSIGADNKYSYSSVAKILFQKIKNNITVYTSSSNSISLQFTNCIPGRYDVMVFNNMGQLVLSKKIQYEAGNKVENINTENSFVAGVYQVKIITPANEMISKKIFR